MRVVAALLMVSVVAMPAAAIGIENPFVSTPTDLYFHVTGMQDYPINTQEPALRYSSPISLGMEFGSHCIVTAAGVNGITQRQGHTYYGYSSPSYVHYDIDQNGRPQVHQERGMSFDAILDREATPVMHWSMLARGEGGSYNAEHAPHLDIVVRATMREGDDISVGHEAFDQGAIIMQGESTPATLAGAQTPTHPQVTARQYDGQWVYDFVFPLELHGNMIPADDAFNVRIDVFMASAPCDEGYMTPKGLEPHGDPEAWPHLALNVMNPLRIEALQAQFVGPDLVVDVAANTPWGNYDVSGDQTDETAPTVILIGGDIVRPLDQVVWADTTRGHGTIHREPTRATYILWDALDVPPGDYEIIATFSNDQQTANATASMTVTSTGSKVSMCAPQEGGRRCAALGEDEESPGAPIGLAIAALVALGIRRRR